MITIQAQVKGCDLQLLNQPVLATNTAEVAEVIFSFDSEWDDYEKTAMFWGADAEEYPVELNGNIAIVPREAMAVVGKMKIGVYGTKGDQRMVSIKVPYKVVEGAFINH